MTPYPVMDDLAVVLVGAAVLLVVSRSLRVPPILAYMVAGLVLGPITGVLHLSESLDLFAEMGVGLLLFVVGLELSLDKMRAFGRIAVVAGIAQVVLTFGLGAAVALGLGMALPAALITGLVAAFSSTAVVVKLLDRAGEMESTHGQLAIGILLVQDVLVVVVLTAVGGLGGAESGGSPVRELLVAFGAMGGLVLAGVAAARWPLRRAVPWLAQSPDTLFIIGLTWAFGFIVAAETLHLPLELGAFIAGVILAQVPYTEPLRRATHPLADFFLAVFFVALGARIETASMVASWPAALAVSAFVLTVKPLLITVILGLLGQRPRAALLSGLTLGQISEFAFILAGLAMAAGFVDETYLGFVGLVGLVTIGASAVLVPWGPRLASALERSDLFTRLPGDRREPELKPVPLAGHVVVVGMNTLGRILVARFVEQGEQVLAIDTDPHKLAGLTVPALAGDVTLPTVFAEAGIPHARLVACTLQIEDVNSLVAYRCNRLGVPVSIHAFDPTLIDELLELGADHLMVSKHDGIRLVEDGFHRLGVMG